LGSIRLLSEQLINRIAAGEVVERPASVLKELIENSLDAEASRIDIDVEAGGRRLIMVADNGQGMSPDDLLLAVERHATSKIAEETDLLEINTLGFRGEALPSIASVSRMTITSAPGDDGRARRVVLSGGRMIKVEEAARDRGAAVEVRDLFFNVPARRKFLKSERTEAAHLLETAQRFALSRPDLRLIYRTDGQEVLSTSPQEDQPARLARVLGRETARAMSPFEDEAGDISVSGFLGRPEMDRARPSNLYLFVNGRPVADRLLTRAVLEAYRGRLAGGRYPIAVIFLKIDPRQVDVNVHPAKAEVRFREPGRVFAAAAEIMAQALSRDRPPLKPAPISYQDQSFPQRPSLVTEAAGWETSARASWEKPAPVSPDSRSEPRLTPESEGLRPIGQLFKAYILAQGPEGLYIIDQHAAHERILFERLLEQLNQGSLAGQGLLWPQTFELSPTQAVLLESIIDVLARFGFTLDFFGGQTFVLRAAPAVLAGRDGPKTLEDILGRMEDHRPATGLDRLEETLLQSLACHGAVKAGQEMTRPEMEQLLADLDRTKVPTHCPHGRPLIFHLSLAEIEKKFKRS